MESFDLKSIDSVLNNSENATTGVDFTGKSLKLDTEADAQPIVDAINSCPHLHYLTLTGNTLGVKAATAIAQALENHPELKVSRWSDMFTGRMKTEIPPALMALGEGMIKAGARLSVLDLSDNAFGPIGVEGLAKLLQSNVCSELQELRLNNNGLGITGAKLLAKALTNRLPKLKVFIAGRNRLENDGATALAGVFEKIGTLEELALPQNGIYYVGVTRLCAALTRNPRLRILNLNDNTVGPKGAQAAANALPRLKNLKSINFGDCLLKSKGALVLAKALKESSVLLESLDVSHNEIGREACLALVEALTHSAANQRTLRKVVLYGNSLGGSANKKVMKDKLGTAAELSDGDGSDEYESEDEDDEADSDEGSGSDDNSEDSAPEDIQHDYLERVSDAHLSLDHSGVEEVQSQVGRFLLEPTAQNLDALGSSAHDVIDAHLQAIKEPEGLIQAYVDATLSISGLCAQNSRCRPAAVEMYKVLFRRAGEQHAASWMLTNSMLMALGLIKSENKSYKIRWDLQSCYGVLSSVLEEAYFPRPLRDTLKFFIKSKMAAMEPELRKCVTAHTNLHS